MERSGLCLDNRCGARSRSGAQRPQRWRPFCSKAVRGGARRSSTLSSDLPADVAQLAGIASCSSLSLGERMVGVLQQASDSASAGLCRPLPRCGGSRASQLGQSTTQEQQRAMALGSSAPAAAAAARPCTSLPLQLVIMQPRAASHPRTGASRRSLGAASWPASQASSSGGARARAANWSAALLPECRPH